MPCRFGQKLSHTQGSVHLSSHRLKFISGSSRIYQSYQQVRQLFGGSPSRSVHKFPRGFFSFERSTFTLNEVGLQMTWKLLVTSYFAHGSVLANYLKHDEYILAAVFPSRKQNFTEACFSLVSAITRIDEQEWSAAWQRRTTWQYDVTRKRQLTDWRMRATLSRFWRWK